MSQAPFRASQGSITDDSSNIPERWLDLLTGYVELAFIVVACLVGLAYLLHP
jgi:hypothetical protein